MITREVFTEEETRTLGREIGESAVAGEVYALIGDLGAGKTSFTKGLAEGLGIDEIVNSPTFTILQEYRSGRLPLYHFDVYRIEDTEEMTEIGFEDYIRGDGVSLIEWADTIESILPAGFRRVTIEKVPEKGTEYRKITVE